MKSTYISIIKRLLVKGTQIGILFDYTKLYYIINTLLLIDYREIRHYNNSTYRMRHIKTNYFKILRRRICICQIVLFLS